MQIVEEWMEIEGDGTDVMETRMFYELMQQYRHAERLHRITAHEAYEQVKEFIRVHYSSPQERVD
jgi:hypothetical protein